MKGGELEGGPFIKGGEREGGHFTKGGIVLRHPSMNSGQVLRMTGEIAVSLALLAMTGEGQGIGLRDKNRASGLGLQASGSEN
jgi:hypothetical protein